MCDTLTPMSAAQTAQKITVFNTMDEMHVHAANCADLSKSYYRQRRAESWTWDATNKAEIAYDTYADQIAEESMDLEMAIGEHKFFPCVTLDDVLSPELQAQADQYAIDQETI